MVKWERYDMPADLGGRTFLDVGCWEGDNCVEAVRRGAGRVVGVDLCVSDGLRRNLEEEPFEFLQVDVLSETFLGLGAFDVVLCSGVLYHVQSPLALLRRLRLVTRELLVIETAVVTTHPDEAIMAFAGSDDPSGDPTVWWRPNERALGDMLAACGFERVEPVWRHQNRTPGFGRLAVRALPAAPEAARLLPRRPRYMEVEGGNRGA